jgi:nucleotide-binding universal stress UspA family protein
MAFKKLLCPIDFSPGSQHAMRVAVRMANESGAELVLVHVWHLPPVVVPGEFEYVFPADTVQRMTEDVQRGLETAVSEATKLGASRVSSRLLTGVPWDQIVETLRADSAFDLAIMGTHGRTGLSRVLLGSVTEKVIRHAPCPVLATRPPVDAPFDHILCPVDFSESSHYAVELAAQLVKPGGTGITLLHVIEIPVAYSGEPTTADFLQDLDKRSARVLEQWAAQLRTKVSVPVTTRSRIGSPGAGTLVVLDDVPSFDLVVMGSHGRTGVRRVLLGSVAEKVVRHAPCPVLVARRRM